MGSNVSPTTTIPQDSSKAFADSFEAFKGATAKPEPAQIQAQPKEPDAAPVAAKTEEPSSGLDLSGAIGDIAPKDDVAKPTEPVTEPGPKALREEYRKLKQELETERSKKRADPAEVESLKQQMAAIKQQHEAIQKERDEFSKTLAKSDFKNSPEFKEKFHKPLMKLVDDAVTELSEFNRIDESGKEVPVSFDDIRPLLAMKTPQALAKAKELFGDYANRAMDHRQRILAQERANREAIDNHEQIRQQETAQQAQVKTMEEERLRSTFDSEVKRLETEFPEIHTAEKDNPRESEQLVRGRELADVAIFGREGIDQPTRIKAAAIARERAAMFPVMAIRNKALVSKITELEGQLSKLRGGGPGGGVGSGQATSQKPTGIAASLEEFRAGLAR